MRCSNNSNSNLKELKSPLTCRMSNNSKYNSPFNKINFELEKNNHKCKTKCSILCNKTIYKDFILVDKEDMNSLNPKNFSFNTIILSCLTLFIYCFQFAYYRNTVNTTTLEKFKNRHEFFKEFSFYCWRIQSVLIFLTIYIFISKYIIHKLNSYYQFEHNEIQKIHSIEIDFNIKSILTISNLKLSFVNSLCMFFLLASTKFLPLSLCLFLNNSGYILDFLIKKKNSKTSMKHFFFLLLGFLMFYISLYNDFSELNHQSIFNLKIISSILCVFSGILQVFSQRQNMNELLTTKPPFGVVIVIQINSFIIFSILLLIIEIFHYKSSFYEIFGWLFTWDTFLSIGVYMGLIGLLNHLLTIFSTIYLKMNFLKIIKILEISFSDLIAILIFEIYSTPSSFEYYLAILNFTIYLAFIQFSNKRKI